MKLDHVAVLALFAAVLLLGGCSASYVTPGGPADFRALGITPDEQANRTDAFIRSSMNVKPAASFPAGIAVVRVQGRGYSNFSVGNAYGSGDFSVVTTRDVERDEDYERLLGLPGVRGATPLNRLVLPDQIRDLDDLRASAASVHADMLLLYTFDTQFRTDTTVPFAGLLSLGILPNKQAHVASTASAALIDTRSGFIYGLAEGTARTDQLANAWTSEDAVDEARRRAERDAFANLVSQVDSVWRGVMAQYAPTTTAVSN